MWNNVEIKPNACAYIVINDGATGENLVGYFVNNKFYINGDMPHLIESGWDKFINWDEFSPQTKWCYLNSLIKLSHMNLLLIETLRFYANGNHIRRFIPDYLKDAMLSGNGSRCVEEIADRGETAYKALKEIEEM